MSEPETHRPWYRHFWPWFLIVLTGSAVVGGITTLVIALQNPETLVVSDAEYRSLQAEFRPDPAAEDDREEPDEDGDGDP